MIDVAVTSAPASATTTWTAPEIVPDAHTTVVDHFNGSASGVAYGDLTYAPSLDGLGQAGVFGPGTYVKYPMPGSTTNTGTVQMWIKPTGGLDTGTGLVNFNWNDTTTLPWSGWVLQMLISSSTTTPPNVPSGGTATGSVSIPMNQWTHLALTWSPTSTKLYVNGELSGTGPGSPPDIAFGYFAYLNYWGTSQSGPFTGLIDEFAISDVERTATEIAAYSDSTPPEVTINTPADGATYYQGSSITADYAIADPQTGIATSDATTPDGATIDTGTLGSHEFTVTATNGAGLTTTVTHTYTVALADTTTSVAVSPSTTVTYPQSVTLQATVAAVDPSAGTPTGSVTFAVGSDTYTAALVGGVASQTLTLPAGAHDVSAAYLGAVGFATSGSGVTTITVNPATTTVGYTGAYWSYVDHPLSLSATVACDGGVVGRAVTFTLTPVGGGSPAVFTATTNAFGTATTSGTGLAAGEYDLTVSVAAAANCTAAVQTDLVASMVAPSDSASGGGWYALPVTGQKRVNFGFMVKRITASTYKGNLLLIQTGKTRIKGSITAYGRTGTTGVASGTGTLYTYDPLTLQWVNPVPVTFSVRFTDGGSGKKAQPDTFGVTSVSVSGTQLVASPQPLKGGNIQLN